jgi:hypothetical protein
MELLKPYYAKQHPVSDFCKPHGERGVGVRLDDFGRERGAEVKKVQVAICNAST